MGTLCYQCEQTAKSVGCTQFGVCGKDPETAALQDLLVSAAKGISMYASRAQKLGVSDEATDRFVVDALFATVTNVNFDPRRLEGILHQAAVVRDQARAAYEHACHRQDIQPEQLTGPATWIPAVELNGLISQGEKVAIETRFESIGKDYFMA